MSAVLPPAAAWLETRYDRAQRLRVAREETLRRLAGTSDPHRRANLRLHLHNVNAALSRLGATS
ncbi:hypothetical protein ACOQFV_27460 [Nocardiopsis changdeensis]|uniref:Uncharacterized protein n=1 Tax=Nocardiopsis changdeensis TaxID=2831969 RepID=A0ABX8BLP7_9ACTN|nr:MULTISPECIES: hypothetical protein [Nocardiopsis]QUX23006.1 hypothetical protein KGD84_00920 [Nocardiopsis changdeensis]QYX38949.1 hypothetical protein K1J57_10370 [Nocardiopsis sp. MT53]